MFPIGRVSLPTNLLLCPIAGYCDLAFRLTIRPLGGVGLASTDLVNPRGLLRGTPKSMELVETDPADQPLCIQLYGREPDEMAAAAQWAVAHGAVVVDINMGCPVDKVCKRDAGSSLLRDLDGAVQLAATVVRAVAAPVTVKMRLGWDDASRVAHTLAPMLEDVGVAAITVHGRTASQKFSGRVDLAGIARVVESVQHIPVIGNGDIRSPADAIEMIRRTGCHAVMIGRAALGDPWIFRDTHALLSTGRVPPPPTIRERIALMNTHFDHLLGIKGERLACAVMRQRASWYTRHFGPCPLFREAIRHIRSPCEYRAAVDALLDESSTPIAHTIEPCNRLAACGSSSQ